MFGDIILTCIILVCMYLVLQYAVAPAPFDAVVKWLLSVLTVLAAVFAILRVWGIAV